MKVFISHNKADLNCAQEVHRILNELGIANFLSASDMNWGDGVLTKILQHMTTASHLVLILSEKALQSPWIPFETGCAYGTGIRVLPFLTDLSLEPNWPKYLENVKYLTSLDEVRAWFVNQKTQPNLLHPFGMQDPALPVKKRRLTWQEVDQGIDILVSGARKFNPKYIFGINRGGGIVGGMIAKRLGKHIVHNLDVSFDRPERRRVIPYTCKIESGNEFLPLGEGRVCEESDPNTLDLQPGKARILLVDDGYYSGKHMIIASDYLKKTHKNIEVYHVVLVETKIVLSGTEQGRSIIDCSAYHGFDQYVRLPWDPPSWDESDVNQSNGGDGDE